MVFPFRPDDVFYVYNIIASQSRRRRRRANASNTELDFNTAIALFFYRCLLKCTFIEG